MQTKVKNIPDWLKSPFLAKLYQSKCGIVTSNWLNQGMSYMLIEELFFKIIFEFIVFGLIFYITSLAEVGTLTCFTISFLSAHTINWLLNGHFFNLIRYLGLGHQDYEWFIAYPHKIRRRLLKKSSVSGVALYGSFSRGSFSKTSDLDVRVIARPGVANALSASWLVFQERLFAFFSKYPIDIYMATQKRGLEKLRRDEPPVILIDNDKFIQNYYKKFIWFDALLRP